MHHGLHVLVTGETRGYYSHYADRPIEHLGRALATGFAYQGEASAHRHGQQRGEPSGHLPARAFVPFLQNHDQIGNTPFGNRIGMVAPEPLVHAAVAVVLLSPQIPLLFMGEEWGSQRPFPFFCDFAPPLDGRCAREAARVRPLPEFAIRKRGRHPGSDGGRTFAMAHSIGQNAAGARGSTIPPPIDDPAREIVPQLSESKPAAPTTCSDRRHCGRMALGDGSTLLLMANFGGEAVPLTAPVSQDRMIYCSAAPPGDALAPRTAAFYLLAVQ